MHEEGVLWQKIRSEANKPRKVVAPTKVSAPPLVQGPAPVSGPATNLSVSSAASTSASSSSSSCNSSLSANKVQKTGLNTVKKAPHVGGPPMVYDPSKPVGVKRKALTPP
jgi:hypothetical protein